MWFVEAAEARLMSLCNKTVNKDCKLEREFETLKDRVWYEIKRSVNEGFYVAVIYKVPSVHKDRLSQLLAGYGYEYEWEGNMLTVSWDDK